MLHDAALGLLGTRHRFDLFPTMEVREGSLRLYPANSFFDHVRRGDKILSIGSDHPCSPKTGSAGDVTILAKHTLQSDVYEENQVPSNLARPAIKTSRVFLSGADMTTRQT